jgi:hypothetical protein
LSKIHADQISLGAIVAFGIISIIRGWIVPRQVHLDRIADKDNAIAAITKDRDNYFTAWNTLRDAAVEKDHQITKLLTAGEATVRLVDTLQQREALRIAVKEAE